MADRDLQRRVDDLIARPMSREEALAFSHFDDAEGRRATELAVELSTTARERDVGAAIDRAFDATATESVGIVKHAVKLFVTHDPDGSRELTLASPEPGPAAPAAEPEDADLDELGPAPGSGPAGGPPAADEPAGGGVATAPAPAPPAVQAAPLAARNLTRHTPPDEAPLDWYREDPFANDHHHHWHLVYPSSGTPPEGVTQPRQGELFFYMHQQMLARYATERRLAGLPPLEPLVRSDADGRPRYDVQVREGFAHEGFGARAADATLVDPTGPGAEPLLEPMARSGARAREAVEQGTVAGLDPNDQQVAIPVDENVLGCLVEPSDLYVQGTPIRLVHSSLHGLGHNLVGFATRDPGPNGWGGPMFYFETAIKDPVFYRWHKHVDDYYAAFQDRQQPNDFGGFAADVRFRKDGATTADIAVCLAKDIPGADQRGFDFAAWGERELGLDLDRPGPATDTLVTRFARSTIVLPEVETFAELPPEWFEGVVHLQHDEVVYFLRIENTRPEPQDVTVRLFIAHAELAEDRRMWIELDKFKATLDPGPNLVAQQDARSSVVKRKGLARQGILGAEADPDMLPGETTAWCDCGWPYTLLLPSGDSTPEGTAFKLVACVTDHASDQLGSSSTCGSMSFCGARTEYPDRRRMGYPFDRPFASSIEQALTDEPSIAMRDIRIRCATQRPAAG